MSRTDSSLSVSFLDWVVQFSHLLVLTRGLSIHSYPALVSQCTGTNKNIL